MHAVWPSVVRLSVACFGQLVRSRRRIPLAFGTLRSVAAEEPFFLQLLLLPSCLRVSAFGVAAQVSSWSTPRLGPSLDALPALRPT